MSLEIGIPLWQWWWSWSQWPQWFQWTQGAQWNQGFQGNQWTQWAQWNQGFQGNQWTQWAQWNQGFQGNQWTQGAWYLEIPQNSQSANYTLVLWDTWKHIYHPSADTTARTFTIPANASVAYPIGTSITFVNDTSAGNITIAITTDTLILAWAWSTWSRTLAPNGIATAIKITSTRWIINGTNLT